MREVRFTEGQLIALSPRLVLRMLVGPVYVGDRKMSRRRVITRLGLAVLAWLRWTAALPGAVFYDLRRDVLIQTRGGLPGRRVGAKVSRQVHDRYGDDAFVSAPTEPIGQKSWEVTSA